MPKESFRDRATRALRAQGAALWAALLGGVIAAVAALVINHYQNAISNFLFGTSPSVTTQIANIEREGFKANLYPSVARLVVLHGATQSLMLVLRDRGTDNFSPGAPYQPRSDELRIYDVMGDKVVLAYRYLPRATRDVGPWVFRLDAAGDVRNNGTAVIIGSYAIYPMGFAEEPRPLIINWDSVAQRYVMYPIITKVPDIPAPVGTFAQGVRQTTLQRDPWIDQVSKQPFRGYGVADYEIETMPNGLGLIGGYVWRQASHAQEATYVATGWAMRLDVPYPKTDQCFPPGTIPPPGEPARLITVRANLDPPLLGRLIATAWRTHTSAEPSTAANSPHPAG
jgi:hypothetical protein